MIEKEAYVLAAGMQTRYEDGGSKMITQIAGKPAISYTLDTVTTEFPEELVTIISSELFQDFNDYITHNHQKARLIMDNNPGSGSAKSLIKSLPWTTDKVFVTEGNIFYNSSLISDMYEVFNKSESLAVLSVTPNHMVAPTHRVVWLSPKIDLNEKGIDPTRQNYRNIGAYFMRDTIQKPLRSGFNDIIDCLTSLSTKNQVVAFKYEGPYLHLMNVEDVEKWKSFFQEN